MKYPLYLLLLCCLLTSTFAHSQQSVIKFKIRGEIKGLKNDSVVLLASNYDKNGMRLNPDTFVTKASNNTFIIDGNIAAPSNVWASVGEFKSRKTFSFFIEKGEINISGTIDSLENLTITGTPSNYDQTISRRITGNIYNRVKDLRTQLKDTKEGGPEYKNISHAIAVKFDSIQEHEMNFIRTHPNSLLSGTYLYVKQDKIPVEELEALYKNLASDVQNSGYGNIVLQKIAVRKTVAIGNKAPDFQSPDTSNNLVKFADYRGKYVLLEFWAHWCVPCRQEHPHLKEVYKKYKDQGFTILQYSIDDKNAELKWKEAIRKDELVWTQASDLAGFESKVSRLYGVQPIPDNFLIDPDGNIIGRRLRGEELDKKLAELLNKK